MKEKWFCFVDIKYYEEDSNIFRHNKAILHVSDFAEATEYLHSYFGEKIEDVHMWWAGQHDSDCKQELVFSESEFAEFTAIKYFIEHDNSYKDYIEAEKEHERAKREHFKEVFYERSK